MKRKMPAQKPLSAAAPAETVHRESPNAWDAVQVCLFTALLFLAMTVQTGRMSVLLPVLALALSVGRGPLGRLRERFCVPAIAFAAFAAVYGIAAVYATFGGYAVREFYKLIAAVSLSVIALTRFDRRHVRGLLWGVAAVCAVISLINTDAASGGPLFEPFCGLVESLGGSFEGVKQHVWGAQVNGIYNDSNISAGILSLGALCGLHLTLTGTRWWERGLACLLTGMNGMGFFLAMSRAGILCFGLALVVYLAAVGSRERARLFFLVFFNTAVTVGLSVPVSAVSAGETLLPDAATLLCGLPVFVLYEFPARWLARKLEGHGKALAAGVLVLLVAAGAYGVVAVRTTGPYTFPEVPWLVRGVELPAGEYTLSLDFDGEFQIFMENCEILQGGGWCGPEDKKEVSFAVEEPGTVLFRFWGVPGKTLERAVLSDGTEIPMGYPLLPGFLVDRLQGGLDSQGSVSYRLQYDKDGWELFKRSPLLGKGPGSTEGLLTSVQPFYYESLYLHNHILQIMCDCGLLGGIPFLAFLLGAAWLLLRRLRETWKEGGDPLAAALLGCWVMMNAHGLMELNFSIRAYQCEAFLLLLLPVILYGKPLVKEKALRVCGAALNAALCVYLGVFALGLELHRTVERQMAGFSTGSAEAFMEQTRKWIRMDWFDQEQNQLNFVGNAVLLGDPQYEEDTLRYVKALRDSGTYPACTGLAQYYYLPRGEFGEVFAVSREGVAQEASTKDAWNQQVEFYRQDVLPAAGAEHMEEFLDGVLALAEYLDAYSRGRQEEIALTEENRAFLDRAEQARETGLEGDAALLFLSLPLDGPEAEEEAPAS